MEQKSGLWADDEFMELTALLAAVLAGVLLIALV